MKSRTSLFNRTIIVNLWQRYWVAFAAYGFVMALLVLSPLLNGYQSAGKIYRLAGYVSEWNLLSVALTGTVIVNFIAAPGFAALLFSFLYNSRQTGLMASLPVKRETTYVSVAVAAILGMLAVNLVVLAMALGVELLFGGVSLRALGALLLTAFLSILAFFGLAALCSMLTGNVFAGPAVYMIFSFVVYVVENLTRVLMGKIMFGYDELYHNTFMWLSPPVQLIDSFNFMGDILRDASNEAHAISWEIVGLEILAAYAVVGAVLLVLGLKLYKNRAMETAGDTVAIEKLKPVFRLCMTIGSGLVFACGILALFYDIVFSPTGDAVCIALLLIIGGILGYFIAKMLILRTVRVFSSGWKAMGIYAVAVIMLVSAVECNLFGYETHVPDAKDVKDVSIQVYDGNGAVVLSTSENVDAVLKLHENIIANKDFHEADLYSIPATEPSGFYRNETVAISYMLKDDTTVSRRYRINYGPEEIRSADSEVRLLERILNTEEAIHYRNRIGTIPAVIENGSVSISWIDRETVEWRDYNDLSPSEINDLYHNCIVPDIMDGGMGEYSLILDEEWAKRTSTISMHMDIPTDLNENGHPTNYIYFNFNVDTTAKRTMAYLEALGIDALTKYEHDTRNETAYNDLGSYAVDENGNWYNPEHDFEATDRESIGIIGGSDGPTTVVVN